MKQRGRPGAAASKVISGGFGVRAEPPDDLTPEAVAIWREVVLTEPTEFFSTAATRDLLKDYCRHRVTADRISAVIDGFPGDWAERPEDVRKFLELCRTRAAEGKAATDKATKLRITNQSRWQPVSAASRATNVAKGSQPWDE